MCSTIPFLFEALDMGMTKLYGRGAITLSDDRHEYRPVNGVLEVPDHLVVRAKAVGFTSYPLPTIDDGGSSLVGADDASASDTPPFIDPSRSDEDLIAQFTREALDAGYEGGDIIARERLAHLRAGGDGYDRLLIPAVAPIASTPITAAPTAIATPPSLDDLVNALDNDPTPAV